MPKNIEVIYQEIGTYIVQSIAADWSTAWVSVEIADENVVTLKGRYRKDGDAQDKGFRADHRVAHLFLQLRRLLKKDDADAWTGAKFTLERDGGFELEFTY
jgi:hypothetical protein